jgi:hypothetical protein
MHEACVSKSQYIILLLTVLAECLKSLTLCQKPSTIRDRKDVSNYPA